MRGQLPQRVMDDSPTTEDNRDDSGQFTEKYPAAIFIDALRDLGGAAGTADVANEIGCPQRTAYHRLSNLRDDGQIESRQVGGAILWVVENGR